MDQSIYAQATFEQFKHTHAMLEEAVKACPAEEWRKGPTPIQRPAGAAYHILEAAEFFMSDAPKQFPWGARFGVGWDTDETEKLPSQEQILAYLEDVNTKLEAWLNSHNVLEEQDVFPWSGKIWLGHILYHLRHSQHHVADIYCELTHRGLPCPTWQ